MKKITVKEIKEEYFQFTGIEKSEDSIRRWIRDYTKKNAPSGKRRLVEKVTARYILQKHVYKEIGLEYPLNHFFSSELNNDGKIKLDRYNNELEEKHSELLRKYVLGVDLSPQEKRDFNKLQDRFIKFQEDTFEQRVTGLIEEVIYKLHREFVLLDFMREYRDEIKNDISRLLYHDDDDKAETDIPENYEEQIAQIRNKLDNPESYLKKSFKDIYIEREFEKLALKMKVDYLFEDLLSAINFDESQLRSDLINSLEYRWKHDKRNSELEEKLGDFTYYISDK